MPLAITPWVFDESRVIPPAATPASTGRPRATELWLPLGEITAGMGEASYYVEHSKGPALFTERP
jgi:hypothetical protein